MVLKAHLTNDRSIVDQLIRQPVSETSDKIKKKEIETDFVLALWDQITKKYLAMHIFRQLNFIYFYQFYVVCLRNISEIRSYFR